MSTSGPKMRVALTIECSGLKNKDLVSKSDPVCIVSQKDVINGNWVEIGRTEKIKNCLYPKFWTKIEADYHFEHVQELQVESDQATILCPSDLAIHLVKSSTVLAQAFLPESDSLPQLLVTMQFMVIDVDGDHTSNDHLGDMTTTLGSIVGCRGSCLVKPLAGKKGIDGNRYGNIKIVAEELKRDSRDLFRMVLSGRNLMSRDWFGKGDKYLNIKRQLKNGSWELVMRTECIKNENNPHWKPIEIGTNKLNAGNMDAPLKIEVLDWNGHSDDDFIGEVLCTANRLLQAPQSYKVEKPGSSNKKDRGNITVEFCDHMTHPSFLDYVIGGCEIAITVAIDFTASNGLISRKDSLHHLDPNTFNPYQQALLAVGEVLHDYNDSKLYRCYGFGAQLKDGKTSHCFALNGNESNPIVKDVEGILASYENSLHTVDLHGPTNFAEVIARADIDAVHCSEGRQKYKVLLIITDGAISDMEETIDAIVKASSKPLSIVIIGVGDDEFENMHELDADDHSLHAINGKKMERDIVQFVPFRDFQGDRRALASKVLEEIPNQLLSYMKAHKIKPHPRPEMYNMPGFANELGGLNLNE